MQGTLGAGGLRGRAWGSRCRPQTLQVLPPQGESLLSLAQQLGLRVFNRHTVQRKQLSSQVRALQRRYYRYLHLLASDTQVRPGSWGAVRRWGGAAAFPGGETEVRGAGPLPAALPSGAAGFAPGPRCLRCLCRPALGVTGGGQLWARVPVPDLLSHPQVAAPPLPRQYWEALGAPAAPHEQPWPLPVLVQLGKKLAEVLVEVVRMPGSLVTPQGSCTLIPVLYHVYSFRSFRQVGGLGHPRGEAGGSGCWGDARPRWGPLPARGGSFGVVGPWSHLCLPRPQIGILKPHPAFTELLAVAAEHTLTFEAAEVPMLCPPLPWMSPHTGAFLLSPTKLMRSLEGTMQHQRLLDSCPPAELHGALDALTQLGNCAWRVNGRVLDLVLELFTAKGCPRLGVPAPPSEAPRPPDGRLPPSASSAQKAEVRREVARCLKVAREMHSLRSDALYRLSLAQHLRDRVFWLPHNMDFRGRTYPCPPHFNHLGSDLARALLEFAQGRPLGPHGLDWLKIHLVNLTGLKKHEPLRARLLFADEVMDDILDSADRPMTVGVQRALAGPLCLASPSPPACALCWLPQALPPRPPSEPPAVCPWARAPGLVLSVPFPLRPCHLPVQAGPSSRPFPAPWLLLQGCSHVSLRARHSCHPYPARPGWPEPHSALRQGRKWWMEADEPWQALACCMEIARAVRTADPTAYVSHFPVHQVSCWGPWCRGVPGPGGGGLAVPADPTCTLAGVPAWGPAPVGMASLAV